MEKVLAIDTTTDYCSVSLLCNGSIQSLAEKTPREHARRILPMIDQLLTQAQCKISDLDGIAVTTGPGTFTGVRTGLSVAQGLALPYYIPLYPVSSLLVLAATAHRQWGYTQLLTALDARMGEIYYAAWQLESNHWHNVIPACVIAPDKIALPTHLSGWQAVGTGWEVYQEQLPTMLIQHGVPLTLAYPLAEDIIPLVQHHPDLIQRTSAETAEAEYLRNDVAKKQTL